jgi:Pectate lyase superfamily protein/Carboxypeptidase regulatory-like domain/Domain of unknown function (DUF4214)
MWLKFLFSSITVVFLTTSLWASERSRRGLPDEHLATKHRVNHSTNIFNLRDYGAVGNGTTDDGPALQLALNAAANAGGGTVYVPAGRYAIITPVTKDFSTIPAGQITIQGVTSSTPVHVDGIGPEQAAGLDLPSEFVIKVGQAVTALNLSGLTNLLIKDLVFIGTLDRVSDALVTLSLSEIRDAKIQHCEFYGLASFVAGGAIVLASRCRLNVTETAFLGCTVGSGYNGAVLQNIGWKNITVTESVFMDYGLRTNFWGKTTWGATYSWIGIGNAAAIDNLSPRRETFVYHIFLDEGHINGIASRPDLYPTAGSAPIDLIYISRLRMNVNNLGFNGLYLSKANRVFIGNSHFGWSHDAASAVSIVDVREAVLDVVECVEAADTIYADASTNKLTVINSVYQHLASSAQTTVVINTATPSEDPAQYVAQQFRNILGRDPDAAGHDYWTNQLLLCAGVTQCLNERRSALGSYLASSPLTVFSINGRVTNAVGIAMPGVSVTLSGSQAVTTQSNSNGDYTFADLPTSGRYVITPAKNHYNFNPTGRTFTTPSGNQTGNFTALLNTHVINGIVSSLGSPLAGVTITLGGGQTRTTSTNAAGAYSFTVDAGRNYTLTAARAHYTFDPSLHTITDLSADVTFNFSAALNRHRISGRVLKVSGEPLDAAMVVLSGSQNRSTTTSSDGTYSFVDVGGGSNCTITATKANYLMNPQSRTFNDLSADQIADFTATPRPVLLTVENSTRAIAVESITFLAEPFSPTRTLFSGPDNRTRVMLFATQLGLLPDEGAAAVTAEAQDVSLTSYPLIVEYVGPVPGSVPVTMIIVRLNDNLAHVGDVIVTITVHGLRSNSVRIGIGHVGGGPPNPP